jgi:DNA-binding response OmpR family regulator
MRVLIVEDKRSLAHHVGRALEGEGYGVGFAYDGDEALTQGRSGQFDLLLLDVMLPGLDGLAVIRQMRSEHLNTQTIIVSARDSMQDIVFGLDAGADDYLTKPFALDVLLAKVRAAARRLPKPAAEPLCVGDLQLHPQQYEARRGERAIPLTRTECQLLAVLMRRAGTVVPHGVLIDSAWDAAAEVGYDSLYVFIRALRSKLTHEGEPELLHTLRGVGYTLRCTQ